MLKANEDGTFSPNLTDEEKAAMRTASAILSAMARVGLANNHAARCMREFVSEHCKIEADDSSD